MTPADFTPVRRAIDQLDPIEDLRSFRRQLDRLGYVIDHIGDPR